MLTKLELVTNNEMILSKSFPVNKNLKYLSIPLQSINDLYVLLDGLVPNLIVLNVNRIQINDYYYQNLGHVNQCLI